MEWRRKWKDVWDSIQYCSDACRRTRLKKPDHALEEAIIALLEKRSSTASICPSEAARVVFPMDWMSHMEAARQASRPGDAQERRAITHAGNPVDHYTTKDTNSHTNHDNSHHHNR